MALQGNIIALCSDQLTDQHAMLRQWLALCLGKVISILLLNTSWKKMDVKLMMMTDDDDAE